MSGRQSTNRRDFLRGRVAETAEVPISPKTEIHSTGSENESSGYLEQYTKQAMACQFEILLNMRQYPQAAQAVMDSFGLIDQLEDQMTVYRDHSEISVLNREASQADITVEPRLFELLELAVQIHLATDGAFDITSSPLTNLWGFDQRSGSVPEVKAIEQILVAIGTKHISLNQDQQSLRLLQPEVEINLGGIGKGYALDRVAELFAAREVNDFILHGGQSSVVACGSQLAFDRTEIAKPEETNSEEASNSLGWVVGLSHPTVPNVRLAEFTLRDQALGTSGTGRQGFYHQGKRYGHIIDPRTGWPIDHVLSSTVISPSAAVSDALATAFFVMQLDEVEAYCQQHPEVAAMLVVPGKSKGQIGLEWFNLAEYQWRKLV